MASFGKVIVEVLCARISGEGTFFPNADPNKHHALIPVMVNRGKNRAGEEMTDRYTLNFWGKYAIWACKWLTIGREVHIEGELRSYNHPTGAVNATGKPIYENRVQILVHTCYLGRDSMKEQAARINTLLNSLKAAGRDLNGGLTAEELLVVNRTDIGDYNPVTAAQTGMYGCCRVWVKGQGFLGNGAAQAAVPATPAASANVDVAAQVKALQEQLAALSNMTAASAGTNAQGPVDPFPG